MSARTGWLLAGLLLLGAALRLVGLDRFPFEQDELYTVIEARHLFDSPLHPGIEARPLYYLLEHPLLELWPVTHISLRILPFLFGMLGIWMTWKLGKEVFGTIGAALATFLVIISPWHLHASGMARYWSLIYLLSATFCYFLIRAYRTDRPVHFLAALAALVLGAATHPTFVFPMAGIALATALVRQDGRFGWRWPSRRAWCYLWIPFLVLMAAAFLALKLTGSGDAVRNWDDRGWGASLRLIPAMVEWMTPVLFALGALGALLSLFAATNTKGRSWSAMAILGTLFGMTALVAASSVTSVYADYGISFLPLVFVSAGGLVALGSERMSSGRVGFAIVASLVLLAAVLPSTVSHLSDGMRFDYRPAFREIAMVAPEVPVLTVPIILQRHYAPDLRGIELFMDRDYLDQTLEQERDLWGVIPVRRDGIWQDGTGEAAAWLSAHCRLVSSYQRPRLDYRVYRTDLVRCRADDAA